MQYADTIVVPVRLSKLTVELVDQQAKARRMNRSTWLRETVMRELQQRQQWEELEGLLDAAIRKINGHTTAEIDTLTNT